MMSIEEKLVQTLAEMGLTISTAESCTGGMVASTIVDIAGASDIFNEGFITYSNDAKMKYLKVSEETLDKYGAVSEEVVREMASGCRKTTGSDVSIVTSGVAGPGGGTVEKPVGLVFIACAYKDVVEARSFRFEGNRTQIRQQATKEAIEMVMDLLENQ
mgnify:CR=1 FL=1